MSRTSANTNVNRVKSPVKFYLNFSAEGTFDYWNAEVKKRVSLGESLDFVVMDTRSAVGGWSDARSARIYSNRVKSVAKEEVNVRCGTETIEKGLWSNIKDQVKVAGGKFCTQVFALVNIDGTWEPAQIDFMGSSLGDWMSFVEELGGPWAIYNGVVVATKAEERKKGKTIYHGIEFATTEISDEVSELANAFNDDLLQPYLNSGTTEAVTV